MLRSSSHVVATIAVVGAVATACGGGSGDPTILEWKAAAPVSPVVIESETVLYAERLTGRVMRIDLDRPGSEPMLVAQVDVDSSGEQRGLIGLSVLADKVYGAWTRAGDQRLVIGEIQPVLRPLWFGPPTSYKAIGGHLDVLNGRLVVGLGELVADPDLAGKIITLDPNGPVEQTPIVLSEGWHNPFAFIVRDGEVIVADNAPEGVGERLGTQPVPESAQRAPSAAVVTPDGRIGVCGYLDREMRAYTLASDGTVERAGTIVKAGCATGAAALGDGRYVVTDETTVRLITPEG